MAYLITGASGGVGASLVTQLVGRGLELRTLTRRPLPEAEHKGVKAFLGDLTTSSFPDGLFDGVEKVFLFPAEGSVEPFLTLARSSHDSKQGVRTI